MVSMYMLFCIRYTKPVSFIEFFMECCYMMTYNDKRLLHLTVSNFVYKTFFLRSSHILYCNNLHRIVALSFSIPNSNAT